LGAEVAQIEAITPQYTDGWEELNRTNPAIATALSEARKAIGRPFVPGFIRMPPSCQPGRRVIVSPGGADSTAFVTDLKGASEVFPESTSSPLEEDTKNFRPPLFAAIPAPTDRQKNAITGTQNPHSSHTISDDQCPALNGIGTADYTDSADDLLNTARLPMRNLIREICAIRG
jgi:hypothetical protein